MPVSHEILNGERLRHPTVVTTLVLPLRLAPSVNADGIPSGFFSAYPNARHRHPRGAVSDSNDAKLHRSAPRPHVRFCEKCVNPPRGGHRNLPDWRTRRGPALPAAEVGRWTR